MSMPDYLTSEYRRIGVDVKDDMGLTFPVIVNVATGIMHREFHSGCLCMHPDIFNPPKGKDAALKVEERKAAFSINRRNHATLASFSQMPYRACRLCEKAVKERQLDI